MPNKMRPFPKGAPAKLRANFDGMSLMNTRIAKQIRRRFRARRKAAAAKRIPFVGVLRMDVHSEFPNNNGNCVRREKKPAPAPITADQRFARLKAMFA